MPVERGWEQCCYKTTNLCYASRALTDIETRHAPIETEMLAVVFSCRKFHRYIYGRTVKIETDHKPLQAISTKPLSQVPLRLKKMILSVRGYDVEIRYIPFITKYTLQPIGWITWRKNIYNKNVYRESRIYYIQFLMIKLSLNLRGGSRGSVQGGCRGCAPLPEMT